CSDPSTSITGAAAATATSTITITITITIESVLPGRCPALAACQAPGPSRLQCGNAVDLKRPPGEDEMIRRGRKPRPQWRSPASPLSTDSGGDAGVHPDVGGGARVLLHRRYLSVRRARNKQPALFEALQKLKEELMLLGFISLLLTVFQGLISNICVPASVSTHMLPCRREKASATNEKHYRKHFSRGLAEYKERLLSEGSGSGHCIRQGKVPLLSLEALHHLHIFIFVLAVVHVVFCATTMVLGGAKIQRWKHWEDSVRNDNIKQGKGKIHKHQHHVFLSERARGYWRRTAVVGWLMSFFKQFHASVTKSDYLALRSGFIMKHCQSNPDFDFHKYMMRTLEADFKKVVGISWYLWLFVVIFLLLNVDGWHTYFWLSFLPLVLLLAVGAKLENIITRLAQDAATQIKDDAGLVGVKPSDEHFWFHRPSIVLYLIHFILFQNSFEIAFFFWIFVSKVKAFISRRNTDRGTDCCLMFLSRHMVLILVSWKKVLIQILSSYSTLPLYAIVSQMGEMFKKQIFADQMQELLHGWAAGVKGKRSSDTGISSFFKSPGQQSVGDVVADGTAQLKMMASEAAQTSQHTAELEEITVSAYENPDPQQSV
ncbi:hypothetical protein Taro_043732, partial [Colocasia esculenta]|nr:hypothetical protein [Colocasia esculenta]